MEVLLKRKIEDRNNPDALASTYWRTKTTLDENEEILYGNVNVLVVNNYISFLAAKEYDEILLSEDKKWLQLDSAKEKYDAIYIDPTYLEELGIPQDYKGFLILNEEKFKTISVQEASAIKNLEQIKEFEFKNRAGINKQFNELIEKLISTVESNIQTEKIVFNKNDKLELLKIMLDPVKREELMGPILENRTKSLILSAKINTLEETYENLLTQDDIKSSYDTKSPVSQRMRSFHSLFTRCVNLTERTQKQIEECRENLSDENLKVRGIYGVAQKIEERKLEKMNVFDFYREKQEHEENLAKALIESKKETTKVLSYIKTADRVLFDDTENVRRIKQELEIKKIQDKSKKINIQNAVNLYTEHRELFDRCSERFGTPAARDYSDLNSKDAEICETINNILDKNNNSLFNQKNTYYFKDMKKGYYIESERNSDGYKIVIRNELAAKLDEKKESKTPFSEDYLMKNYYKVECVFDSQSHLRNITKYGSIALLDKEKIILKNEKIKDVDPQAVMKALTIGKTSGSVNIDYLLRTFKLDGCFETISNIMKDSDNERKEAKLLTVDLKLEKDKEKLPFDFLNLPKTTVSYSLNGSITGFKYSKENEEIEKTIEVAKISNSEEIEFGFKNNIKSSTKTTIANFKEKDDKGNYISASINIKNPEQILSGNILPEIDPEIKVIKSNMTEFSANREGVITSMAGIKVMNNGELTTPDIGNSPIEITNTIHDALDSAGKYFKNTTGLEPNKKNIEGLRETLKKSNEELFKEYEKNSKISSLEKIETVQPEQTR